MSDEELSTKENVELLIQARDAIDAALQQALAQLPESEREEYAEQEVEGFSLRRFAQGGSVQISIPSLQSVSASRSAWVSLNPQPLPPRYQEAGIILIGG
jgi:hypothetical protein